MNLSEWVERFNGGDVRALSRIISRVENSNGLIPAELKPIFSRTGGAYRIGVTGPPGAGKSTLVDWLCSLYRQQNLTVGVIAVDPTSPFSGGALLGDRIRMTRAGIDPGVFIRSMATRGTLGGLAESAMDAADILDAFGKDIVILETVGVGQSELDVARAADTTVVVLVPESGDGVQAMKAGLMEISDIFVLNKADRPMAERAALEIEGALELKQTRADGWKIPVLMTVANKGEGLPALVDTLKMHFDAMKNSGSLEEKRKDRRRERIRKVVERELRRRLWSEERFAMLTEEIENGDNPFEIAADIIGDFEGKE